MTDLGRDGLGQKLLLSSLGMSTSGSGAPGGRRLLVFCILHPILLCHGWTSAFFAVLVLVSPCAVGGESVVSPARTGAAASIVSEIATNQRIVSQLFFIKQRFSINQILFISFCLFILIPSGYILWDSCDGTLPLILSVCTYSSADILCLH